LASLGRLGCAAALVLAAAGAWWFRAPLARALGWGPERAGPLPRVTSSVGAPSPAAVASANAKLAALERSGGPDSVVLTANEVASWVGGGIDWSVRRTFDSLRVELRADTLVLHARLDTRAVPPEALGPFAGFVEPREPLRIAGPVSIASPGNARFTVAEMALRDFAFPPVAVRSLARRVAGASEDGALLVPVPSAVRDVRLRGDGMVLYRSERP
jgi:hypothetical protein